LAQVAIQAGIAHHLFGFGQLPPFFQKGINLFAQGVNSDSSRDSWVKRVESAPSKAAS
jgi:hypothetical protein